MGQYLPVITLLALAVIFGVLSALASKLLGPQPSRYGTVAKSAPYECGIVPRKDPPERFPVRFYLVAMIFIIFDIEIIFLYPWAVSYREIGAVGLWEIVIFAVVVFASFLYLIANGALDWGPAKKARPVGDAEMVSAARTSSSTIRRVGLEGREELALEPPVREEISA